MKVLELLVNSIRASVAYNADIQIPPNCILWTDAECEWEAAMPLLRAAMPELLTLGSYAPQMRQGPAIWLRCVLARQLEDVNIPENLVPLLYLPRVGRRDLRAVDSCPRELQALAPLQYSGVFFTRPKDQDWTIGAWLSSSDGGLGLDLPRDAGARRAMRAALPKLLGGEYDLLKGKRLDADFFNSLLTGGDPDHDILKWLDGEEAFRNSRSDAEWRAFVDLCVSRLGFDPETEGPLSAAAKLAGREGPWEPLWRRFREAWRYFPNIPIQIGKCQPPRHKLDWFLPGPIYDGWPQWNQEQEDSLRKELAKLVDLNVKDCADKLLALEQSHATRRGSIWAEMGHAPLAMCLEGLAILAENYNNPLASGGAAELAEKYAASGWKMDAAALRAFAPCGDKACQDIVAAILRKLYLPWLEESSRHLQRLFERETYSAIACQAEWNEGDCLLFVDGLRMDCAKELLELLARKGINAAVEPYWAALPSLTFTGKAAISPICGQISGSEENVDFEPTVGATGKPLKGQFDRLLAADGWELLKNGSTGSGQGRAWAEFGLLDHEGHGNGARFAAKLPQILAEIATYINGLLGVGWRRVLVLADHGWLWLPGGLPKSNLPADLVDNKWGRCAIPKTGAIISQRKYPWRWNQNFYFAIADGASCFKSGQEYAHGGLSLQECSLLKISAQKGSCAGLARLEEARWNGLRCRLKASGSFADLRADIRLMPALPETSVAAATKPFRDDGTVSIAVDNDEDEGSAAFIVLLDGNGQIVAQEETVIGGGQNGNG